MNLFSRQDDLYAQAAAAHSRALERLVQGYEANPDKQQDLLQDIHLALWQSFEGYESRCSMRTWVYRVAHNTAASHVVKEQRKNAAPLVTLEDIAATAHPDHSDGTVDRQLALRRLTELIRLLKPLDRQLMLLYLEGVDAESIGEILGISAGHVRVQVHRVKNVLSRRFHGGSSHER
jgi:RNA polymerase sigma-70 factor (ECF subfamily)